MKKLGVTVAPLDLHARPIGSDDRALIRRVSCQATRWPTFSRLDWSGVMTGYYLVKAGQFHREKHFCD
jgi:hypothetical protein